MLWLYESRSEISQIIFIFVAKVKYKDNKLMTTGSKDVTRSIQTSDLTEGDVQVLCMMESNRFCFPWTRRAATHQTSRSQESKTRHEAETKICVLMWAVWKHSHTQTHRGSDTVTNSSLLLILQRKIEETCRDFQISWQQQHMPQKNTYPRTHRVTHTQWHLFLVFSHLFSFYRERIGLLTESVYGGRRLTLLLDQYVDLII